MKLGNEKEIVKSQKQARRIDELSAEITEAGRAVLNQPENKDRVQVSRFKILNSDWTLGKAAMEHFDLLKEEWTEEIEKYGHSLDSTTPTGNISKRNPKNTNF